MLYDYERMDRGYLAIQRFTMHLTPVVTEKVNDQRGIVVAWRSCGGRLLRASAKMCGAPSMKRYCMLRLGSDVSRKIEPSRGSSCDGPHREIAAQGINRRMHRPIRRRHFELTACTGSALVYRTAKAILTRGLVGKGGRIINDSRYVELRLANAELVCYDVSVDVSTIAQCGRPRSRSENDGWTYLGDNHTGDGDGSDCQ
jgi:hypothetical protein